VGLETGGGQACWLAPDTHVQLVWTLMLVQARGLLSPPSLLRRARRSVSRLSGSSGCRRLPLMQTRVGGRKWARPLQGRRGRTSLKAWLAFPVRAGRPAWMAAQEAAQEAGPQPCLGCRILASCAGDEEVEEPDADEAQAAEPGRSAGARVCGGHRRPRCA
jgi:hypothetical protein